MTGEEHDNRRRLWNRGMSHDSLVEYESIIVKRAEQLVSRLKEVSHGGQSAVDVVKWINFFTFDFMGDMAYVVNLYHPASRNPTHPSLPCSDSFGGGYHMLEEGGDEKGLWNTLNRFVLCVLLCDIIRCGSEQWANHDLSHSATAIVGHIPWAHDAMTKVPFISHDLVAFRKIGQANAAARHQAGSKVKDLWYHLVRPRRPFRPTASVLSVFRVTMLNSLTKRSSRTCARRCVTLSPTARSRWSRVRTRPRLRSRRSSTICSATLNITSG